MEQMKNIEIVKEYTIENSILNPQIEIKGKMPISGVITLDNDCNVLGDFNDDKFIAHADSKAQIITITKK